MKKIILTMTMAAMALMMVFASSAEAGRKIKIIERTQRIDRHHVIVWHEYKHHGTWVKHGPYEELFNGRVMLAGEYNRGRRVGRWTRWSLDGRYRKIKVITYENGRKISVYRPVYKKRKVIIRTRPERAFVRIDVPHLRVRLGF